MFEVPGSNVKTVLITEDCVNGLTPPEYISDSPSTNSDEPTTTQSTSSEEEESAQVRVKQ